MARLRPFDGSCFFADTKGTLAKFTAKFTAKFDKVAQTKCVGIDLSGTDLICSRPCGGAFGAGAPLFSASDLASCFDCTARNFVEDRKGRILGRPLVPIASKDVRKCHAAISRGYGKHPGEVLENRDGCSGAYHMYGRGRGPAHSQGPAKGRAETQEGLRCVQR